MTTSVTHTRAATRDLGRASELLLEVYDTRMELRADPPPGFRFATESVSDESFGIARLLLGGVGTTHADSFSTFVVACSVGGELSWRIGPETSVGSEPFLIVPYRRLRADWQGLDVVTLTLDVAVVREAALARTGRDDALRLREVNPPGLDLRYMRGVLQHLQTTARTAPDLLGNPLVRAAMRQSAVDALLASYPVLESDPDPRQALPRSVRRAMAFLDDHLADPITAADIARAAGVSLRALELGFRSHLGRTPREHLRLARLSAARVELISADAGTTTVQAVARRWGFAHLSRFAEQYRREYGESPSETLRR